MGDNNSESTISAYKEQLQQVELALSVTPEGEDRNNLLTLQSDIRQLIELTESTESTSSTSNADNPLDDEYSLFMAEMEKVGALDAKSCDSSAQSNNNTSCVENEENQSYIKETTSGNNQSCYDDLEAQQQDDILDELKDIEGMKCRAPHKHTWGDLVYHNALVTCVMPLESSNYNQIEVKVLFTNPTHQEMLPCPYLLENDCKFSEDKCRFSHGEVVPFSELEEYVEPDFENLQTGSFVLVKDDRLWRRGKVKRMFKEKCLVKVEGNNKEVEVDFCDVLPMNEGPCQEDESEGEVDKEDVINMSLMITPCNDKMGDWEKFTKGIGSRLMEKMGYIVGSGLGKRCDGRIEPVTAVVLPAGKSLDHCMELREKSGGDKNLFSVERKMKRLQRKQELRNQKIYERESKKVDVFKFINSTISDSKPHTTLKQLKTEHRREIKKESCRDLNIESLKIDESIKEIERDLFKIKGGLSRHRDINSQINRELRKKLALKENELKVLRNKALNINNEKSIRSDKKKLTVF